MNNIANNDQYLCLKLVLADDEKNLIVRKRDGNGPGLITGLFMTIHGRIIGFAFADTVMVKAFREVLCHI